MTSATTQAPTPPAGAAASQGQPAFVMRIAPV